MEHLVRRLLAWGARSAWSRRALAGTWRLAPVGARAAQAVGGRLFPASVRDYPARLAPILGEPIDAGARVRLAEARLVFMLARIVLNQALLAPARAGSGATPEIAVEGREHLDTALARGRGAVLISGHFGLPPMVRPALGRLGVQVVGAGSLEGPGVDVLLVGDIWARARSLHRLREALSGNRVGMVLVDSARGRHTQLPFLAGRLPVALGAFHLARLAGCALLPFFAVLTPGWPAIRLDITPALDVAGPMDPFLLQAAAEFARRYAAYVRRYPAQAFAYEPLRAGRAGGAE